MNIFHNKVAIVTGATKGIGREIVDKFISRGCYVVGVARSKDILARMEEEYNRRFKGIAIDITESNSEKIIVEETLQYFGKIDFLVNNAGGTIYGDIIELSNREIEYISRLNFLSAAKLTREVLPHMLERKGGWIINIITGAVFVVLTRLATYGAAKAALHYFTEALRKEVSNKGIRVIGVYPGAVRTSFFDHPSFRERGGKPATKPIEPSKVAEAIVRAVERGKERVYVPWWISLLKIATVFPVAIEG